MPMAQLTEELVAQVLDLPEADRIDLAVRMLDSVDDEVSDTAVREAWLAECRRRIAESEAGVPGIPIAELWRELDERKRARTPG